jgi:hypothetical protein
MFQAVSTTRRQGERFIIPYQCFEGLDLSELCVVSVRYLFVFIDLKIGGTFIRCFVLEVWLAIHKFSRRG